MITTSSKGTSVLSIMTFNIRYDNPEDGLNRWDNRKDNVQTLTIQVCNYLLEELPSVLGVQECKPHQRQYINDRLRGYYHYVGIPRDLHNDEEVGIFYLSSRFFLLDFGFRWLNEDGTRGKPGFGCVLPRNLTYVVLRDCKLNEKIICINNHFDLSEHAQRQSVPILLQTVTEVYKKWSSTNDAVTGIYLFGDFNCNDSASTF